MFYHNTIKRYTTALLDFFSKLEVQYENEDGSFVTKNIPITFKTKEKKIIMDKTQKQIMMGNLNTLPRASLELSSLNASSDRQTSKYNIINRKIKGKYQFNCVSYEFSYTLKVLCRGMTEACQIVEEIAPKFNPNIAIDIYDADNEEEPTRIPIQLESISIENEGFDEKSLNICTVACGIKLFGFLFQPIKDYSIIKELKISLNTPFKEQELMEWNVVDGKAIQPPTITNKISDSIYIKNLKIKKLKSNTLKVEFETNSTQEPSIEWYSQTAFLTPKENNSCTYSIREMQTTFDVVCIVEVEGVRHSIYKEFILD